MESQKELKFVIAGPMGSGKTTAIQTLTEGAALSIEVPLSPEEWLDCKNTTTVGFDFGVISVGGYPLYIYGTPGQEHFQVIAHELLKGSLGVLLLINVSSSSMLPDAKTWLDLIKHTVPGVPVIVALNRAHPQSASIASLRATLVEEYSSVIAVQCADPRRRLEILNCLRLLTLSWSFS